MECVAMVKWEAMDPESRVVEAGSEPMVFRPRDSAESFDSFIEQMVRLIGRSTWHFPQLALGAGVAGTGGIVSLLGRLVKTAVNVALVPAAVVKDAVTMGDDYCFGGKTATEKAIERLRREADEDRDQVDD